MTMVSVAQLSPTYESLLAFKLDIGMPSRDKWMP
jgi:hypothetical protein